MNELKQIINHRLKFLSVIRNKDKSNTQSKQQIIDELLKQRRLQKSQQIIESRLQQILATHKVQVPYSIEKFFTESLTMMQLYDPLFSTKLSSGSQQLQDIVFLYIQFFEKQRCFKRSQQLKHIYQKNVCQKSMLIPTMLSWFSQWIKKVVKDSIKQQLNQLKQEQKKEIIEVIPKRKRTLNQSIVKLQPNKSILGLKSYLSLQKNISIASQNERPSIKTIQIEDERRMVNNLNKTEKLQKKKINQLQLSQNPSYSKNLINLLNIDSQNTQAIKDKIYLNKDIFFAAFYEQINSYYKFNSNVIAMLDENYPRNFRKLDRRQEIIKNMNIVIASFTKNQPLELRNTINEYALAFPKNKRNLQSKIRSYSQNYKKHKNISSSQVGKKKKQEILQDANPAIIIGQNDLIKRRIKSHRIQAEKKHVHLELPEINNISKFKSAQKIILVSNMESAFSRYSRNDIITRVSAEIYKQFKKQDSVLSRSIQRSRSIQKRKSLSMCNSSKEQNNTQIKYAKNEKIFDIEDNETPIPRGVFHFPRIGK